MALPDRVQLHGRLPARHQHHARHPRGLERHHGARVLTADEPLPDEEQPRPVVERLLIRTDGAARGNPGPASCGAVLIDASKPGFDDPDALPVAVVARALGHRTNNVAEYAGLVLALREAHRLSAQEVDLRLDSKLIVEQLNGRWRVKDAKLQGLFAEAVRHLKGFRRWKATHEPRARNRAADALANLALDDPMGAARLERHVRERSLGLA
ncbi:MAG: ribonuclease HI family protein [Chloroflexota bacterium]